MTATEQDAKQTAQERWHVGSHKEKGVVRPCIVDAKGYVLAELLRFANDVGEPDRMNTRARLMASAPALQARNEELVGALQQAFDAHGSGPTPTWTQVQAAYESINAALSGQASPLREENERLKADLKTADELHVLEYAEIEKLKAQRDELLEAASEVESTAHDNCDGFYHVRAQYIDALRSCIVRLASAAKGGAK